MEITSPRVSVKMKICTISLLFIKGKMSDDTQTTEHEAGDNVIVEKVLTPQQIAQKEAEYKKLKNKMAQAGFELGRQLSKTHDECGYLFFNLSPEGCDGDPILVEQVMAGINKDQSKSKAPPKRFPYHLAKLVLSASTEKLVAMFHIPDMLLEKLTPADWASILTPYSPVIVSSTPNVLHAEINQDLTAGVFPFKLRDIISSESFQFLRSRGLYEDPPEEDEPDYAAMNEAAGIEW